MNGQQFAEQLHPTRRIAEALVLPVENAVIREDIGLEPVFLPQFPVAREQDLHPRGGLHGRQCFVQATPGQSPARFVVGGERVCRPLPEIKPLRGRHVLHGLQQFDVIDPGDIVERLRQNRLLASPDPVGGGHRNHSRKANAQLRIAAGLAIFDAQRMASGRKRDFRFLQLAAGTAHHFATVNKHLAVAGRGRADHERAGPGHLQLSFPDGGKAFCRKGRNTGDVKSMTGSGPVRLKLGEIRKTGASALLVKAVFQSGQDADLDGAAIGLQLCQPTQARGRHQAVAILAHRLVEAVHGSIVRAVPATNRDVARPCHAVANRPFLTDPDDIGAVAGLADGGGGNAVNNGHHRTVAGTCAANSAHPTMNGEGECAIGMPPWSVIFSALLDRDAIHIVAHVSDGYMRPEVVLDPGLPVIKKKLKIPAFALGQDRPSHFPHGERLKTAVHQTILQCLLDQAEAFDEQVTPVAVIVSPLQGQRRADALIDWLVPAAPITVKDVEVLQRGRPVGRPDSLVGGQERLQPVRILEQFLQKNGPAVASGDTLDIPHPAQTDQGVLQQAGLQLR